MNPETLINLPLTWRAKVGFGALAVASFHLAYGSPGGAFLIVLFLFGLFHLANAPSNRAAMWTGIIVGLLAYSPQLSFFYTLFRWQAVALWAVMAFWPGVFLLLLRQVRVTWGVRTACVLAPVVWTGVEYFRGELYPLRFTWMSPGYAFANASGLPQLHTLGMYGTGFVLMASVGIVAMLPRKAALISGAFLLLMLGLDTNLTPSSVARGNTAVREVHVAAIQLEHKHDLEVLEALKLLHKTHPEAEVLVMSELTFDGPVTERVKKWCREERVYFIAGGKDPVAGSVFYNTVFVIGPTGEVVFKQAKTRPVQFMADGLPAPNQHVWDSPWGKIGLCICYDLSFTRVTDELVRQGAQALIVPTADEIEWGEHQHRLHGRVAPVRAAEYRIPIFRVASSGFSQHVDPRGHVLATAAFPGQLEMMAGTLRLASPGTLPLDRWLAPACSLGTGSLIVWFVICACRNRHGKPSQSST